MNRRALLQLLTQASADLPLIDAVIAPFGLEVSPEFVAEKMNPQRLYLYGSTAERTACEDAAADISEWVVQERALIEEALGRELAYVTAESRRNLKELDHQGLGVHVYVVPSDSCNDLSLMWGNYSTLLPLAICQGVLNEYVYFDERPSCRRFVFQCARMFPFIHGIEWSETEASLLREAAVLNGSRSPGNPLRIKIPATTFDQSVLHDVVLPKCREISMTLAEEATELTWIDFHTRATHVLAANSQILASRANFIADAYKTWGLVGAE